MNDEYHPLTSFTHDWRHKRPPTSQSTAILLPLGNKRMAQQHATEKKVLKSYKGGRERKLETRRTEMKRKERKGKGNILHNKRCIGARAGTKQGNA